MCTRLAEPPGVDCLLGTSVEVNPMRRRLTEYEADEARQKIESVGRWLRQGELARSVSEDLLGHEIRSILVRLGHAVARRRRDQTEQLTIAVEASIVELHKERAKR